jgi:DNA-binding response OmpR family regulator
MSNILVVEDDSDLRDTYAEILEFEGYSVHGVGSSADAIDSLIKLKPDLVILDMQLNGESGTVVLSFIRKYPRLAATKVIIASGFVDMGMRAREWGADMFLAKPITAKLLISSIEGLLREQTERLHNLDSGS